MVATALTVATPSASAVDLPSNGHLTLIICGGNNAIVFYGPSATPPSTGGTTVEIETR